jgi:hypothetical protein
MTTEPAISLEAGCEILAQLFDKWADQAAAKPRLQDPKFGVYRTGCDATARTWREAARYLRKTLDESRPVPGDFQAMTLAESNALFTFTGEEEGFEHVDEDELADRRDIL